MADPLTELPPGFVLDKVTPVFQALPPGFVLDTPEDQAVPPIPEPVLAPGAFTPPELPPEEDLGFIERVRTDIEAREQILQEIQSATAAGEQTFAEGILQVVGKVGAGAVLDFLGEALVSGAQGLSAITPDVIEDPIVQTATKAAHLFLDTDIGKAGLAAAERGLEAWNEFRAENPRAARNIEAVVDIGLLIAPVKGKPKIKSQPTLAGQAAEAVAAKGVAQTAREKSAFVDDLILPKPTAAVKTEQVARTTEEGLLGTKTVGLSSAEKIIADEVSLVEGVSASKTLQGNFTAISEELATEAKTLKDLLKKNDVLIPKQEFLAELDRAILRLEENPLIVGDAAATARKVVENMKRIVAEKPGTASGLLEARKALDAEIRKQRPKVFDPAQESALSTAVREVRTTTNDFIDLKAVNVEVKDSLRKQSNLFRAMDNIAPKAANEASNAILRAWQNANKVLGLKSEFNQILATAFGIGGLGAAATFAPLFTKLLLTGVVGVAAGKAILSPTVKKGVSKLLGAVDKAIRTSKDEALISRLRLDRAAIVEILEQSDE